VSDQKTKVEQAIAASKAQGDWAAHGGGRAGPATTDRLPDGAAITLVKTRTGSWR
jgi:hypothetical protein